MSTLPPHHLDKPNTDGRTVLEAFIARRIQVKTGDEVFHALSPFQHLYIINKGVVKVSMLLIDGREQVTGFYIEGEMFGLDGIALQEHQCEAIALTPVELCVIDKEAFGGLIQSSHSHPPSSHSATTVDRTTENPTYYKISEFLMQVMSREIRRDQRTIAMLGALNAEEKIVAFLLNLSYRYMLRHHNPSVLDVPMSRSEIGNYLGVTPETVSRSLSKLHRDKLIEIDGREIILQDIAALRTMVGPSFS